MSGAFTFPRLGRPVDFWSAKKTVLNADVVYFSKHGFIEAATPVLDNADNTFQCASIGCNDCPP